MRIVIAAKALLASTVVGIIGGQVLADISSGTAIRRRLHEIQPEVVFIDETAGLANVPRIGLVDSAPTVIALMWNATLPKIRRAGMSGCYDVIDLTATGWRGDLWASLFAAQAGRRASLRWAQPAHPLARLSARLALVALSRSVA